MRRAIDFERVYAHPPAKVYRALTDSDLLAEWLMPNDFRPVVGHRFTFRSKPYPGFDGVVHCEVLRLDEPREVAFSWRGGGLADTEVSFRLEPVDGGAATRLHFRHAGFEGLLNRLVARNVLAGGWRGKLLARQLPALLDRL